MILGLIEDYQKIITNPETCSNVLVALSELMKYILDTKMEMINYELMERRKSGEVSCYIVALKEHISKLEIQNNKLWDSVNGSSDFETVFETEPGSPGDSTGLLAEIQSENMKKIQTYRENNAMLESARTELERVSLGSVPNFPKSLKVDECLAKIEEMQIQMDSVVNKMTENIGYNHSLIEQLNVKYTVLSNQIQELENRAASTPNDLLAYSVVQTKFDTASPYPSTRSVDTTSPYPSTRSVDPVNASVEGYGSAVSTPSGGALYGGSVPPNFVPFLKRGVHCPPPGFSYPPQGVRPQHRTVPATPPRTTQSVASVGDRTMRSIASPEGRRNKDKYNKNKERNELLKKHKDLRDKKE